MTDGTKFKHPLTLLHPNPYKGEGASPYSSPLTKGGLRGVMQGFQRKSNLCVHGSPIQGGSVLLYIQLSDENGLGFQR
jgi:hypothetical protein